MEDTPSLEVSSDSCLEDTLEAEELEGRLDEVVPACPLEETALEVDGCEDTFAAEDVFAAEEEALETAEDAWLGVLLSGLLSSLLCVGLLLSSLLEASLLWLLTAGFEDVTALDDTGAKDS